MAEITSGNKGKARLVLLFAALFVLFSALGETRASAAAPANDLFENTLLLSESTEVQGTTIDATSEPGDPWAEGAAGHSVWYHWIAPSRGTVEITNCLADTEEFSSQNLRIFEGETLAALEEKFSGYGNGTGLNCGWRGMVEAGQRIEIGLTGASPGSDFGQILNETSAFKLRLDFRPSPSNDELENAEPVSGENFSMSGDSRGATVVEGEKWIGGALWSDVDGGRSATGSLWYRWRPTRDVLLRFSRKSGDVSTIVVGSPFASFDSMQVLELGSSGSVEYQAYSGVTYVFGVYGPAAGFGGPFSVQAEARRPPNDDFENAIRLWWMDLAPLDGVWPDFANATRQDGEPFHNGSDAQRTVWYRVKYPKSGSALIDACGSYPTSVAAYAGTRLNALRRVGSDECRLLFKVDRGRQYNLALTMDDPGNLRWSGGFKAPGDPLPRVRINGTGTEVSEKSVLFELEPVGEVIPYRIWCRLDKSRFHPCPWRTRFRRPDPGIHKLEFFAVDIFGNRLPKIRKWTFRLSKDSIRKVKPGRGL